MAITSIVGKHAVVVKVNFTKTKAAPYSLVFWFNFQFVNLENCTEKFGVHLITDCTLHPKIYGTNFFVQVKNS